MIAYVSFLGSKPVVIYEMFKTLATRLSIALFLSHDLGEEDASEISELMTTHWRGIISVPLSMRVPWYGWKSGYSKALAAKVGSSKIRVLVKGQGFAPISLLQQRCLGNATAIPMCLSDHSEIIDARSDFCVRFV